MDEKEFLQLLSKKAAEQKKVTETEILPEWARGLGEWLAINPWRVIVPAASIIYLIMRFALGTQYRELILAIFGGY